MWHRALSGQPTKQAYAIWLSAAPAGQEAQEAPEPLRRLLHASIPPGTRADTRHLYRPLQRAGKTPQRASHRQSQRGCREECCSTEARLHQPSPDQCSLRNLTRPWLHSHRPHRARQTHDQHQRAAHAPAQQSGDRSLGRGMMHAACAHATRLENRAHNRYRESLRSLNGSHHHFAT